MLWVNWPLMIRYSLEKTLQVCVFLAPGARDDEPPGSAQRPREAVPQPDGPPGVHPGGTIGAEQTHVPDNDSDREVAMPINHWPATERPREKLLARGARTLSNAELLAVLLGSGCRGQSALDLATQYHIPTELPAER